MDGWKGRRRRSTLEIVKVSAIRGLDAILSILGAYNTYTELSYGVHENMSHVGKLNWWVYQEGGVSFDNSRI